MTDFASHLRGLRRSESTVRDYTGDVELYSTWHQARHGAPAAVATINRVDVNEWLREQSEADVAPATMNRRLASLKAWVRWGQETGQIDERHDPLARVHGFKTQNVGPRWLQRTDQGRLARTVELRLHQNGEWTHDQRLADAAMIALMRYAGLRAGEVVQLRIGDLNISQDGKRGTVVVRHGKGDKRREVPLHSKECIPQLQAWLEARTPTESDQLFVGKRGPLTYAGLYRRLRGLTAMADVECTPHQLRHTAAKELINAGAQLSEVAAILGHERLETTMRYISPDAGDLARAMERMA